MVKIETKKLIPLTSATAERGVFYFDDTDNKIKVCENGTNFKPVKSQETSELMGTSMDYDAVSIGSSATLIKTSNSNRVSLIIFNNSSNDIYIGGSGVTTSTGFLIESEKAYEYKDTDALYGVSSAGGDDLRFIEVGL